MAAAAVVVVARGDEGGAEIRALREPRREPSNAGRRAFPHGGESRAAEGRDSWASGAGRGAAGSSDSQTRSRSSSSSELVDDENKSEKNCGRRNPIAH